MSDPLLCCYADPVEPAVACAASADWEVHHGLGPEDCTHACSEHLGFMLTDAEEHRVYRLDESAPLQEQPAVDRSRSRVV
jgi:hypothetical protein